ncbi:hypothetical protein RIR_jg17939.t1 [Rhizophagus irregularis DAOM 181602=DAOM 197198]|nr:hypothetical protein RIR_jg17939.t1 [Rhizophagus irregularis DAOM 181602=DAOM 197198]
MFRGGRTNTFFKSGIKLTNLSIFLYFLILFPKVCFQYMFYKSHIYYLNYIVFCYPNILFTQYFPYSFHCFFLYFTFIILSSPIYNCLGF